MVGLSTLAAGYASGQSILEEVIVTAQRRETNLQDTAISITVLGKDDLRARSLSSTAELAQVVPNLQITPVVSAARSPNAPAVFIRGIGQNDFIIQSDPAVGLYIDGVYLSRATGSIMDLLDVERIEVLRGPQGTLFGKNTTGGALNITTRAPSDRWTYEAEVIGGRFERVEGRGYVSGPLADNVKGKLAFAYKEREGHGKRLQLGTDRVVGRLGGNENIMARGGLHVDIGNSLTLDISADVTYNRDDAITSVTEWYDTDPTQGILALYNGLVGFPSGTPMVNALLSTGTRYDNYAGRGPTSFGDSGLNHSDQDIYGINGTFTWESGPLTLKSITSYRNLESTLGGDGDGSPLPFVGSIYNLDQEQVTQELQAYGEAFDGRLTWLGGVYYLNEDASEPYRGHAADGLFQGLEALPAALIPLAPGSMCPGPFPPNVCVGGAGNPFNSNLDIFIQYDFSQTIDSYAVFGEATFRLNDKWALTAGVRYTEEDKTLVAHDIYRVNSGVQLVPPDTRRDVSYNAWTPRFRLEFTPQDDLLLYTSVSRGFKAGGINGRVFDAATFREFRPEFVWTYEGGFKADLLDNQLRLNGAVFFNDYEDLQFAVVDITTGSVNAFLTNAAAAEILGFELEADARVNHYFDIGGSLSYLDTEVTEAIAGTRDLTVGQRLQKVPEWAFTLYGVARRPFGDGYEISLRADYSHKSKFYNDASLTEAIAQDAYGLLNLRMELASPHGWTLAAFGANVTDERHIIYGLDGTAAGLGFVERGYGRPAEWGVSLRYVY